MGSGSETEGQMGAIQGLVEGFGRAQGTSLESQECYDIEGRAYVQLMHVKTALLFSRGSTFGGRELISRLGKTFSLGRYDAARRSMESQYLGHKRLRLSMASCCTWMLLLLFEASRFRYDAMLAMRNS